MRILQPKVEYWAQGEDWKAHVARCARVCYASNKTDNNDRMLDRLISDQHLSMFRHRSMYWAMPKDSIQWSKLICLAKNNPYIRVKIEENGLGSLVYVSTNGHFYHDKWEELMEVGLTEENQISEEDMAKGPGKEILRYTFWIRTQISTSRELNRVSPNNISEQSTRFCNYTQDKFGNQPAICTPWWFDLHSPNDLDIDDEIIYDNWSFIIGDRDIPFKKFNKAYAYRFLDNYGPELSSTLLYNYLNSCDKSMGSYIAAIDFGMKPQDARGLLPLDTCTEVVYTYFRDEWERLFENRVEGKRGLPHPNARLVMELVQSSIEDMD